jgi:tricorn protease-like protein
MKLVRISFPSGQADTLTEAGEYWYPTWSPDGRHIAYSIRTGHRIGIYIMDIESGYARRVVNYCDLPNWLTSDSLLYINQDRNFPVESICISDTLGYFGRVVMPPQNNIVTYYGMKINIPTKRIAFCGVQEGEPESIWAVDPGRTWARPMRDFASLSCFSPDGEKIVFTDIREGYGRLYTYKWNGGEIRQLTH